jgi:pyruvate kinase
VTQEEHVDGRRTVRGSVTSGGTLRPRVGVNLPDSDPDLPAVTARDLDFARAMHAAGVDLVAVSFCRDGDDLRRLRDALRDSEPDRDPPWLVSKIERPQAIVNLVDVVQASDAVLVARGDLGVEMDIAEVPVVQKRIVAASIAAGRPVVVATQMLQSMIEAPGPTRAEATDVANAVLDGADALMLSGETAIGRHPVLAVETLRRIARATERWRDERPTTESANAVHVTSEDPWLPALARGVHRIARELPIRAIVAWSGSGHTARILSREDLRVPLLVVTDDVVVARRMRLLRGVRPIVVCSPEDLAGDRDAFLGVAREVVESSAIDAAGDACLFVHGSGRDATAPTDAIGIFRIDRERRS